MNRPLITLTTDFGLADPSVGICKGVILSIAPDARILDLSHGIPRQSVIEGAGLLAAALPYFPTGIHVAVVDPGVGTGRRPVAIRVARGDTLVGPDNGLLSLAASALGGATAAVELANDAYRLSPVSRTFHGRDIFAPAAAHLAAGVPFEALGPSVALESLTSLDLLAPVAFPGSGAVAGSLEAVVISVDSFGTLQLLAAESDLERSLGSLSECADLTIHVDGRSPAIASWARTYGDVPEGELLVLVDSYGRLAIAVNLGSAAARLRIGTGDRVTITR